MARTAPKQEIETRRGVGILGAVCGSVFTVWTAYLVWDGFTYWAIPTALVAVLGWFLLLLVFTKEASWFAEPGRITLTAMWLGETLTAEELLAQFQSHTERIWCPERFPEVLGSTTIQADEDDQTVTVKMEGTVSQDYSVRMLQAFDQELAAGWRMIDESAPTARTVGYLPKATCTRKTRIRLV
jgi:hypothetical protein